MAEPGTEAPVEERCYRHPHEVTRVHCTRCGRPICPDCMHPAPVGHHCPTCMAEGRMRIPFHARRRFRVFIGRPGAITSILLLVYTAVFLVEVALGGPRALVSGPSTQTLFRLGALNPAAIAVEGQYWRLLTATVLHAGLLHIMLNGYALYLFGQLIEATFGPARFVTIYVMSGFLASVASYLFSDPGSVGVGASGAIFGLLGAWLAYNWRRRELAIAAQNLRGVVLILALNLAIGLSFPGIDNYAHIGGFVAGIGAGTFAEGFGRGQARTASRVLGFAALIVLGVALTMYRTSVLTDPLSIFN